MWYYISILDTSNLKTQRAYGPMHSSLDFLYRVTFHVPAFPQWITIQSPYHMSDTGQGIMNKPRPVPSTQRPWAGPFPVKHP